MTLWQCLACDTKRRSRAEPGPCRCGVDAWAAAEPGPAGELGPLQVGAGPARRTTGSAEVDAMLGGGLVLGSSVLVVGPPGSGKSRCALRWGSAGGLCVVASLEMGRATLGATVQSAGIDPAGLLVAYELGPALGGARAGRGGVLVVDSAQRAGPEGVRAACDWAADSAGVAVVVSQVNARDRAAGRRSLEHDPDVVIRVLPSSAPGWAACEVTKSRHGIGPGALVWLGAGAGPQPVRSKRDS